MAPSVLNNVQWPNPSNHLSKELVLPELLPHLPNFASTELLFNSFLCFILTFSIISIIYMQKNTQTHIILKIEKKCNHLCIHNVSQGRRYCHQKPQLDVITGLNFVLIALFLLFLFLVLSHSYSALSYNV